jgi:RNA polymerase sigma factor (sigma-70 family)
MTTSQMSEVIQHLRGVLRDGAGLTDGQLLEGYIRRRDEAAFAAIVRRHGPMVWGVCCRVLRNHHDAEDAFQASFLVLVRRAVSIASRELLANWLYGVAHRTALKAKATVAKRKGRERQVTEMPEPAVTLQDPWRDLQPLLDEELSRLPDKYRGVIVLCDLEGKTRKEAARHLGLPEGTVASRLARARSMLAKRFTKRGLALSGGALAAVLAQQAVSAGVPVSVVDSTIKAASLLVAGNAAATGLVSVKVAALTEGVMKAMLFNKLKWPIALVLILGFMATGVATLLTNRTAAGQDDKKPTAERLVEPAKQQKEKEPFTAWGKEVGGLQAGLGFRLGQKRTYHHGETATVVLRLRNVSKKEVEFVCCRHFFMEESPTMTDRQGKPVRLPRTAGTPTPRPEKVSLGPGKEIELYELKFKLRPASENGDDDNDTDSLDFAGKVFIFYGTGRFLIQYERLIEKPWAGSEPDPILRRLATGKLELEIKSDPPRSAPKETAPAAEHLPPLEGSKAGDRKQKGAVSDIGKIDRRIAKEPRYESEAPWYCLLLLGEAKTKVWMVLDGNKLYVDRNANGDLTDDGDPLTLPDPDPGLPNPSRPGRDAADGAPAAPGALPSGSSCGFRVPDIAAKDGRSRYTDLRVVWGKDRCVGDGPFFNLWARLRVGEMEQWAFVDARATTPGKAPLVHFDGPLQMELRIEGKPLILAQQHLTRGKEVLLGGNICTRYPGVEWVGLSDEKGIPADIHPIVDIELPAKGPDTNPIRLKVPLKRTWGLSVFYSPVRVPGEVGIGKASMTISFPDWKGAKVAATTLEVPVNNPEPE